MKKLNVILDETTIINFGFFKKLLMRYYITSLALPILVFSFFAYSFNSQNSIFQQSKSFKNVSGDNETSSVSIAALIGEKQDGINAAEIISNLQSLDFHKELARTIYEDNRYDKINFNELKSKVKKTTDEHLLKCNKSKKCIVDFISSMTPEFISVTQDRIVEKKFHLNVKSLDKWTTKYLLVKVEETIQKVRKESIQHMLLQQKKLTENLVIKKEKELENNNPTLLDQENRQYREKLQQMTSRLAIVQGHYHSKKVELDLLESKLEQTQNTVKRGFRSKEKALSKKAKALNDRIEKLRQDISAIEASITNLSLEDNAILKELKIELVKAEKELYSIPSFKRYIDNTESFLKKKDDSSNNIAFETQVKKKQFERIQTELFQLQNGIKEISTKQKIVEQKLESIKPTLEYIKLLKTKLIQLALMESTVLSDFVFSENVGEVTVFKRTSKGKMLLFAFCVTFFLLFSIVLVRYLFDTKIYDEYELQKNFENLEIIGNTPDFNS